jgi:hypothetical protein
LTPLPLKKALQRFLRVIRVEGHLNNMMVNVTQELYVDCFIFKVSRKFWRCGPYIYILWWQLSIHYLNKLCSISLLQLFEKKFHGSVYKRLQSDFPNIIRLSEPWKESSLCNLLCDTIERKWDLNSQISNLLPKPCYLLAVPHWCHHCSSISQIISL